MGPNLLGSEKGELIRGADLKKGKCKTKERRVRCNCWRGIWKKKRYHRPNFATTILMGWVGRLQGRSWGMFTERHW